jgi:RNA polymerase sigma-70 factor (ECF subfamily)
MLTTRPGDFSEQSTGPEQYNSRRMGYRVGYLRLVHSAPPVATPASGCLEAFERDLDYIFATLQRLGAAPCEIEDLAQEVFMVLHRNWTTLDTDRPLRPYLFGVAFRIVCAHRRRRAREILYPALDADDSAPGPEGSLQSKESIAFLLTALESVPMIRRAVVIMHDLDGVPIVDVARTLSIGRFAAYARLRKGRRELTTAVRRLSRGGTPR